MTARQNPGPGYRIAERGLWVPAYAEALGVTHPSQLQYVRMINGRLIYLPPQLQQLVRTASSNNKAQPSTQKPSAAQSATSKTLVHELFTPLEQQAQKLLEWGPLCNWLGYSEYSYKTLLKETLDKAKRVNWPVERLKAVVLVPYLPGSNAAMSPLQTLSFLLDRVAETAKNLDMKFSGGPLSPFDRDVVRVIARNRWRINHATIIYEVIDLGAGSEDANWNIPPAGQLPEAAVLAAAALHPQWLLSADGKDAPFVAMPAYELNISTGLPWRRMLALGRTQRDKIAFSTLDIGSKPHKPNIKWAVPQFCSYSMS